MRTEQDEQRCHWVLLTEVLAKIQQILPSDVRIVGSAPTALRLREVHRALWEAPSPPRSVPQEDLLKAVAESWQEIRYAVERLSANAAVCLRHAVPLNVTDGLLTILVPAPYGVPGEHLVTLAKSIMSITGILLEVEFTWAAGEAPCSQPTCPNNS